MSSRFSNEEWEAIQDVALTLKYFSIERKYGYIDRLANSYSSTSAESALLDALRDAKSAKDQGETVHLPSENNFKKVVELIHKDLSTAKILAALSFTYFGKEKE